MKYLPLLLLLPLIGCEELPFPNINTIDLAEIDGQEQFDVIDGQGQNPLPVVMLADVAGLGGDPTNCLTLSRPVTVIEPDGTRHDVDQVSFLKDCGQCRIVDDQGELYISCLIVDACGEPVAAAEVVAPLRSGRELMTSGFGFPSGGGSVIGGGGAGSGGAGRGGVVGLAGLAGLAGNGGGGVVNVPATPDPGLRIIRLPDGRFQIFDPTRGADPFTIDPPPVASPSVPN